LLRWGVTAKPYARPVPRFHWPQRTRQVFTAGNYTDYQLQRDERREYQLKEYERQQEFIAKEEDYIRRNIAGQNTRQAQGRRTRLERLKKISEDLIRCSMHVMFLLK
jgi:ATPase subunit of ABC transporter with duplicated ATPase domains